MTRYFCVKNKEEGTYCTTRAGATPQLYTTRKRAESSTEIRLPWLSKYYEVVEVELKEVNIE